MADSLAYPASPRVGEAVSRRTFFGRVGGFLAVGALLNTGADRLLNWQLPDVTAKLERSTFARHLGETFHMYAEGAYIASIELAEVADLASASTLGELAQSQAYREGCFSAIFRGPIDHEISQDTYTVEHDRIGSFALFIVPLEPKQQTRSYVATFNRLPV